MAIWRSRLLEDLLGGPLDETGLTAEALQRLCDEAVPENEQLEFKGESAYNAQPKGRDITWRHEQEFAKDVAAFANHLGGVILIGVEEADGAAARVAVGERPPPEVEHRRLAQALGQHAAPAVRATYVTIPVGQSYATAVVVPPSDDAPHGVAVAPRTERRPLCFPVRDGAHTRFLAEAELADRYQRRFLGAAARQDREQRIVAEGCATLATSQQDWFYLAVVPGVAADATMNRAVAAEFHDWIVALDFGSPLGAWTGPQGRPIPGPGRLTVTEAPHRDDEDAAVPREDYLELHADGAVFGARALVLEEGIGVLDRVVADALVQIVDVGLRWSTHRVGRWGSATIVAGVTRAEADQPLELWDFWRTQWRRIPQTRRIVAPEAHSLADLTVADTIKDRLVSAYDIGSRLLQHFGLAEIRQITPEGAVNTDTWSGAHQQVAAWAGRFGVETANSTVRRSPWAPTTP